MVQLGNYTSAHELLHLSAGLQTGTYGERMIRICKWHCHGLGLKFVSSIIFFDKHKEETENNSRSVFRLPLMSL